MAGTFRFYFGWAHSIAGRIFDFFDPRRCENEVETTGTRGGAEEQFTVPAEDSVEVYNYLRDGDFEAFAMQIIGEGYLHVYIITDTPTSAVDLSPSGNAEYAMQLEMANHAPFVLGSDQVRTSTTPSNIYGLSGYTTSTGTGTPSLIGSGSAATGKIYSIIVYNPDDEDSVAVVRGLAN